MNYAQMAFSGAAKGLQERYGSRASYARIEAFKNPEGLTADEIEFIAGQDNFYMATIGENGFPYIQFRGGPKGFLKVLDQETLGFVDFEGNKQYISVGNLETNKSVSLFLLDQAAKVRLKLFAEAEVMEISQHPEKFEKLDPGEYAFQAQRLIVFHVKAYDWNCPKHITERYSLAEIQAEFSAQHNYISQLRAEISTLKEQLASQQNK